MFLLRKALMAMSVLALGSAAFAQDTSDTQYATGMRTLLPASFTTMFGGEHASSAGCASCATGCDTGCNYKRVGIFGDYLYMRMHNSDVTFAQPVDGLGPQALPTGQLAQVSPGFEQAFRAGIWYAPMELLTIRAQYWSWDGNSQSSVEVTDGSILRALTTHPSTDNAALDSLSAAATVKNEIRIIDVDGLVKFVDCGPWTVQGVGGVRFAKLNQQFQGNYTILGDTQVNTSSYFRGIGPRVGLESEVRVKGGLGVYGKGNVSFLLGEFSADYQQQNPFQETLVRTGFEQNRLVTNVDLELGVSWSSCDDHIRLSAGYLIQSWSNVVSTNGLIEAVQQNAFTQNRDNLRDTLIFDGFVFHLELRF